MNLTWDRYTRMKARVCCGSDCSGCAYLPRNTLGNKQVDPELLRQLNDIQIDNAPYGGFQHLESQRQGKIVRKLRNLKGNQEDWILFNGPKSL